ncbi:MAG: twin-arginine translocation signal domain-containing protein, partial [Isosphaeraceae bacterium]
MLTILGRERSGYCDGVTRRDFLKLGGLALGGLSLPQLLQAEAKAGIKGSHKAVIMIFLAGGPPHMDMFDLKPEAPASIRGEYKP